MLYKQIKDLNASAMGFGCWAIGGTWNNIDDKHSIDTIRAAIAHEINFFDVAPVYGKGHAETVLGQALRGVERERVIIATKCGLPWDAQGNVRNDLTEKNILEEVDASLARLGTDYIDLYQVHWPDPNTAIEETATALAKLKEMGKIRHVGVSNYSLDMTREMMRTVEVATFQGLYNLLEQNPTHYHNIPLDYRARDEALPFCAEHDMLYLPYSPLMQGLLTGNFKPSGNFDANDDRAQNPKLNGELFKAYYACTEELKAYAAQLGRPLAQLAMHWLVAQEEVGPVIAGAHSTAHIEENVAFAQWAPEAGVLEQLEAIVKRHALD